MPPFLFVVKPTEDSGLGCGERMEAHTKLAKLDQLLSPILDDLGYEIVRIVFTRGARATLQIMAERKDRVNMVVEDCIRISRAATTLLEVNDPLEGDYLVEVSSPGIDRPLVKKADFIRFDGEIVKIELSLPIDGRKKFMGRLMGLNENDEIILSVSESEGKALGSKKIPRSPSKANQIRAVTETQFLLPFATILKARLVVTDELLAKYALQDAAPDDGIGAQN
ncbi:MAG: ribosome maturation factor RimP [Candidatus Pacebacteria bacterium]|nr:ribosome maturation factor RimP [Candidatus Paceibacterota bacterium]